MKYLKEITVWDKVTDYTVPNHTYMVNDEGNLAGYIKTGTKEEIIFKKPIKNFTKSRRKFVTLNR
tara:strand:+ start:422 stop:616 length:195 start_codon:yes stop_codon:yes gene_type:complete